jgi:hypothetical protein
MCSHYTCGRNALGCSTMLSACRPPLPCITFLCLSNPITHFPSLAVQSLSIVSRPLSFLLRHCLCCSICTCFLCCLFCCYSGLRVMHAEASPCAVCKQPLGTELLQSTFSCSSCQRTFTAWSSYLSHCSSAQHPLSSKVCTACGRVHSLPAGSGIIPPPPSSIPAAQILRM